MKKKEVLVMLISEFADWECAFLSAALNGGLADADPEGLIQPKYAVKTIGLSKEYALSFGGLRTVIDYDIHSCPDDYAALILIGGSSWKTEKVKLILPLVEKAIKNGVVLGAICDASLFLGVNGFLNNVKHTSNTLEALKNDPDSKYSNEKNYLHQQAVAYKNILTGNGTAYLEFTRELLSMLNAYTPSEIERFYNLYKFGFHNRGVRGQNEK